MVTENFFADLQAYMAHKDHNTTTSQGMFQFGSMRACELEHEWREQTVRWDTAYTDSRLQYRYPGQSNALEKEALDLLLEGAMFSLTGRDRTGRMSAVQGAEGPNDLAYRPMYATIYVVSTSGPGRLLLVAFFNPQGRSVTLGGDPVNVAYYANVVKDINLKMTQKAEKLLAADPPKKETP